MATSSASRGKRDVPTLRGRAVSPIELDDLDKALIEKLREDGRAGNRQLAAELNVNEVTIAARLRRLEDADVMRVVAITDIRLFGHREFAFAMIEVVGRPVQAVAADLAKLPETISVTICTGRYDIVVPILGRDRFHLSELYGTILPKVKGVNAIHGCMGLDVLKYNSRWALFGVEPGPAPEAVPSDTVDEMDLAIIALLQQNARRSNRQIAAELGVSEGTVRVRIKRMLADRVFRIQAISDIVVSGVDAHAFIRVAAAPGKVNDVAKALARRDDVAQVTRVLDDFGLVALLHSSDRATLMNSIMNEIAQIPGVRRTETLDAVASLKHTYAWTWIV
ncbi:Lrp/AsnC family transcriptional regulator [Mycolicibacterium litorale]|uniref:Lrp/AsnC family transcriptional regulator n=1 Tax=Mycolicibacterium litorale TaxID=758802 RepID=UPI003CEA804D